MVQKQKEQFHPTPDSEGELDKSAHSYGHLDYGNDLDEIDPIPQNAAPRQEEAPEIAVKSF